MDGLDDKLDVWLDTTAFCNALQPLLRLAARAPGTFSDTTGQEAVLQVEVFRVSFWNKSDVSGLGKVGLGSGFGSGSRAQG